MATKKVKSLDTHTHGKQINLPVVGLVDVSKDGTLELPDDLADMMVSGHPNFEYVVEEEKSNTKKKDIKFEDNKVIDEIIDKESDQQKTEEVEDSKLEINESSKVTEKEVREGLENKSLKNLIAIIDDIEGIPAKKKKEITKNKEVAIDFLIKNVDLSDLNQII